MALGSKIKLKVAQSRDLGEAVGKTTITLIFALDIVRQTASQKTRRTTLSKSYVEFLACSGSVNGSGQEPRTNKSRLERIHCIRNKILFVDSYALDRY